jgi:hypothetical protein
MAITPNINAGASGRRPDAPHRRLPGEEVRFAAFAVGHATAQVMPLSVKAAGLAELPVWVAWKPMLVEPPAGIEAL